MRGSADASRQPPLHARDSGFTLLEILVAVAIFAIAAQLAYGGLRRILEGHAQLLPRHEAAAQLRYAVTMLDRDIAAVVPRPVRDAFGAPAPALQGGRGDEVMLFSRSDAGRPTLLDAVAIYRVGYRLRDGDLLRDAWPVIDTVQGSEPATQRLLSGVRDLRVRFLAGDGNEWGEVWPVEMEGLGNLPRAVELVLVLDDGRSLRRLLLPGQGG